MTTFLARERMVAIVDLLEYACQRNRQINRVAIGEASYATASELATAIAKRYGVGVSTIWEWKRRFNVGGYDNLARRARSDKDRSSYFLTHSHAHRLLIQAVLVDSLSTAKALAVLRANVADPPTFPTVAAERRRLLRAVSLPGQRRGRR